MVCRSCEACQVIPLRLDPVVTPATICLICPGTGRVSRGRVSRIPLHDSCPMRRQRESLDLAALVRCFYVVLVEPPAAFGSSLRFQNQRGDVCCLRLDDGSVARVLEHSTRAMNISEPKENTLIEEYNRRQLRSSLRLRAILQCR